MVERAEPEIVDDDAMIHRRLRVTELAPAIRSCQHDHRGRGLLRCPGDDGPVGTGEPQAGADGRQERLLRGGLRLGCSDVGPCANLLDRLVAGRETVDRALVGARQEPPAGGGEAERAAANRCSPDILAIGRLEPADFVAAAHEELAARLDQLDSAGHVRLPSDLPVGPDLHDRHFGEHVDVAAFGDESHGTLVSGEHFAGRSLAHVELARLVARSVKHAAVIPDHDGAAAAAGQGAERPAIFPGEGDGRDPPLGTEHLCARGQERPFERDRIELADESAVARPAGATIDRDQIAPLPGEQRKRRVHGVADHHRAGAARPQRNAVALVDHAARRRDGGELPEFASVLERQCPQDAVVGADEDDTIDHGGRDPHRPTRRARPERFAGGGVEAVHAMVHR